LDIQGILAFIGGLSALVMVHELGHFAVAKAVGIRVEGFSIFFGQPLLSVRRATENSDPDRRLRIRALKWAWGLPEEAFQNGETEYAVRYIPFGGYVKMSGQSDFGEADVAGSDWEFTSKPLWARAAVVAAGPFMNFVLAFAMFATLNVSQGVIGRIGIGPAPDMIVTALEDGSPAAELGLVAGTRWIAMNGVDLTTWDALGTSTDPDDAATVTFEIPGGETVTTVLADGIAGIYELGAEWEPRAAVGSLIPLEPAGEAGLAPGDRIVAVDGEIVTTWSEMSRLIQLSAGREVRLTVDRSGSELTYIVEPSVEIATSEYEHAVKLGVTAAIGTAFAQTWNVTTKILRFLERLVTRAISPKYLAGPVGILHMTGVAAQQGLATYLGLLAVLSANLAVVNLLPIAVLDGGHLLFFAYEGITRKRPSPKQQGFMQQAGIIFLLATLVMVTIIDIGRMF